MEWTFLQQFLCFLRKNFSRSKLTREIDNTQNYLPFIFFSNHSPYYIQYLSHYTNKLFNGLSGNLNTILNTSRFTFFLRHRLVWVPAEGVNFIKNLLYYLSPIKIFICDFILIDLSPCGSFGRFNLIFISLLSRLTIKFNIKVACNHSICRKNIM